MFRKDYDIRFICSNCGKVIYSTKRSDVIGEHYMIYSEVIRIYNGRCPYCGKILSKFPLMIRIINRVTKKVSELRFSVNY